MSLVTKVNQPSSDVAIRLEKLQNLYQVLTKNKPNQHISKEFINLEKIDRHAIRTMNSAETIGHKHILNKIAMRDAVERHMEALKKAEQVFQTAIVKDQAKGEGILPNSSKQQNKNPLVKLPQDVLVNKVLPFLTREEATNFQTACIGYSSLTASRFHRLNNLSHAILQDQAEIPVLFQELHKDDRTRILDKFKKEKFDWNQMKEHKKLLLKEIEMMKVNHSFTIPSSKSINYLQKLSIPRISTSVGPFLTEKERADLRRGCKATHKIQSPASSIIKTYHLENLIETYLHVSSSALTPSDKAKALHNLMSMAYSLSEFEELPYPEYSSLSAFFQQVEARNLIRMIRAIHERHVPPVLPNLPAGVEDLHIPNDPTKAMQQAGLLRDWIHQGALSTTDKLCFRIIRRVCDWISQGALVACAGIGRVLDLSDCGLSLVPKEVGYLSTFRTLNLSNNHLVSVPEEIGQLKALQGLYLYNNCLVSIPKEIVQLKALQNLYLYNNRLVSIPKEIGQLKALEHLQLEKNRFVSVPKEIGQLQALEGLYLYNNRLVSIPKEIGQLKALEWLQLENNRLVSVPKEIGQLQALRRLHLENNRLLSVPKEIGQLQALQQLQLDNNRLLSVPKEIGQLQALEFLSLKTNGLIGLPPVLDRFKGAFMEQNRQLQVKNFLRQLSLCVTGQHNTKKIADLLDTMEKLLGKKTRSQLHHCLYEVVQEAAKADKTLRKKLKGKQFGRKAFLGKAFLDGSIDPKLKAAAIARFRDC